MKLQTQSAMKTNTSLSLLALSALLLFTPKLSAGQISCLRLLTPKEEFEIEADFQKAFAKQAAEDQAYLKQLADNPSQTYLQDRAEIIEAERIWRAQGGKGNFHNVRREKRYRPILERIAGDLLQRQSRKYGEKHKKELKRLHRKAWSLLADGDPPYKATARFIMNEYLPMLDVLLFERHPYLRNKDYEDGRPYHRRHAKHLLEKFLNESPDVFLHFSFEWVDDRFFVNSRPTLVNIIGLDLRGLDDVSLEPKLTGADKAPLIPLADNYIMPISEFAWHDMGHAEFTVLRDLAFLRQSGKPIERVMAEWEGTMKNIMAMVDQAAKKDADLADAMVNLLFEIVRERGFQFSLSVLKQELDTEKWVEVIVDRKLPKGFYSHYPSNESRYARMNEARLGLLRTVERLKEEAQMRWYAATNQTSVPVPVQIGHSPSLTYAKGRFSKIRITSLHDFFVDTVDGKGKAMTTPIRELVTAQVSPTKKSAFEDANQKQMLEKVLYAMTYDTDGLGRNIKEVELGPDRIFYVVLKNDQKIELSEFAKKTNLPKSQKLEDIQIFEVDQVFGSYERNELIAFTIRPPTGTYYGYVAFEQNLMTGHYDVHITEVRTGRKFTLPLTEVRIDAWEHDVSKAPKGHRRN